MVAKCKKGEPIFKLPRAPTFLIRELPAGDIIKDEFVLHKLKNVSE